MVVELDPIVGAAVVVALLHHWPVVAYAVYDDAVRADRDRPLALALWYGLLGPVGVVRYWNRSAPDGDGTAG